MAIPEDLAAAVGRYAAKIALLQTYDLDLTSPGWVQRLAQRKADMARMYAEEQAVRAEVDGLLPELIVSFRSGDEELRDAWRALMRDNPHFGWGPGGIAAARPAVPASAEAMRDAFAILALKDGDPDWRDEIVRLDGLCATVAASGLDLAGLLTEAASLASDAPRGSRSSLRAVLLERARRT